MTTKFASDLEVVLIPVQDESGKTYQKPYLKVTSFNGDEIYAQLRDNLNIAEFSRFLVAGLDYNTISIAAKFAPLKNSEVESNNKESDNIENLSEENNNV